MAVSGRLYTFGFQNISATAVQDLLALYCGASKIVGLQSVNLNQKTITTPTAVRVRIRYLPITVTAGSGGAVGTVKPWVSGDAAATATARVNDTTPATSSGTTVDLWDDEWNLLNGFLWVPPVNARPPVAGLSGAFIVSLDDAATMTISGSMTFEELP